MVELVKSDSFSKGGEKFPANRERGNSSFWGKRDRWEEGGGKIWKRKKNFSKRCFDDRERTQGLAVNQCKQRGLEKKKIGGLERKFEGLIKA